MGRGLNGLIRTTKPLREDWRSVAPAAKAADVPVADLRFKVEVRRYVKKPVSDSGDGIAPTHLYNYNIGRKTPVGPRMGYRRSKSGYIAHRKRQKTVIAAENFSAAVSSKFGVLTFLRGPKLRLDEQQSISAQRMSLTRVTKLLRLATTRHSMRPSLLYG